MSHSHFVISSDHSSLCTMHLLQASLLQSSPRNGNTDQMLCTFNILAPVVKLCFFLNVFPSIFSSPSSGQVLLTNLAVSCLSRRQPQEPLALQDRSKHVNHPRDRLPAIHRRSPDSVFSQSVPCMIGPQSSSPDSFLTIFLCFWLFSEYMALLFLC